MPLPRALRSVPARAPMAWVWGQVTDALARTEAAGYGLAGAKKATALLKAGALLNALLTALTSRWGVSRT